MATRTGKLEGPAGRSGLARSLSPEHVRCQHGPRSGDRAGRPGAAGWDLPLRVRGRAGRGGRGLGMSGTREVPVFLFVRVTDRQDPQSSGCCSLSAPAFQVGPSLSGCGLGPCGRASWEMGSSPQSTERTPRHARRARPMSSPQIISEIDRAIF